MSYTRDGKNGALKLVLRTHDSALLVTDLCIDIPTVRDAGDAHHFAVVIDDVHDAVIPDADAPEILLTVQFPAAGRFWIGGQAIDLRRQTRDEAVAQVLQLLPGGRLDVEGVSSHAGARA